MPDTVPPSGFLKRVMRAFLRHVQRHRAVEVETWLKSFMSAQVAMQQNRRTRIEHAALHHSAARGRLLKNHFMTHAELEERSFGSSLDPLLHGVAHGLATLFPPIENARRLEAGDEAGQSHEVEDQHTDE